MLRFDAPGGALPVSRGDRAMFDSALLAIYVVIWFTVFLRASVRRHIAARGRRRDEGVIPGAGGAASARQGVVDNRDFGGDLRRCAVFALSPSADALRAQGDEPRRAPGRRRAGLLTVRTVRLVDGSHRESA